MSELPDVALRADILLLPHQGSVATLDPLFVEAVSPGCIINSSRRLSDDHLERLAEMVGGREVIHTFQSGAVTARLTVGGVEIDSYNNQP